MCIPEVARIAETIGERAGSAMIPFRATLFEKTPAMNWLISWHQDTALPLVQRLDLPGWGPWSMKAGVHYAHAPDWALREVVAWRLQLDDPGPGDGALRVLPGSDKFGILSDEGVRQLAETTAPVECQVPRGGALVMSPLIVHASSKTSAPMPRRVLHI